MKPVAWMLADKKAEHIRSIIAVQHDFVPEGCVEIPLYTHPVNSKYDPETGEPLIDGYPLFSGLPHLVKELTDKEITQVFNECYPNNADGDVVTLIDFARAILRKAQE